MARTEALTVRRLSRPLNGAPRETLAVADLDLEARAGQTLALVGPSGSGKSTVLTALAGLVEPSSGQVRYVAPDSGTQHAAIEHAETRPAEPAPAEPAPADTASYPPHELSSLQLASVASWVPQRAASTILRRTVRDELLATSVAVGRYSPEVDARADALLDVLGLSGLRDVDPRRLSGGEQRRLAVAAAVLHDPALVLADEPTVGQDRLTWSAVVGVLDAVRARGAAVVVATHDDDVIATAGDVVSLRAHWPPEPVGGAEPRPRLAARAGPLGLVLVCLLVLSLPALLGTWRQGLVVLAAEAVLLGLAMLAPGSGARPVPVWRRTLLRLVPALIGVAGVVWSTWLLGGRDLEVAVGAALRVLAIVLPSVVLLPFVDPDALGDHLAQRLRLPARPVVAATAALSRFQSFGALWTELTQARRVRGVGAGRSLVDRGREIGATTFGLFVGILGQAAVLALAMDARGFASAYHRTWAGPAPWKLADTLAVAGGLLVLAAATAARVLLPA